MYTITIIWRADDVSISTATGIKHMKKSTDYQVVGHQFHPDRLFSVTYQGGMIEYFNMDAIFSVKVPKA